MARRRPRDPIGKARGLHFWSAHTAARSREHGQVLGNQLSLRAQKAAVQATGAGADQGDHETMQSRRHLASHLHGRGHLAQADQHVPVFPSVHQLVEAIRRRLLVSPYALDQGEAGRKAQPAKRDVSRRAAADGAARCRASAATARQIPRQVRHGACFHARGD